MTDETNKEEVKAINTTKLVQELVKWQFLAVSVYGDFVKEIRDSLIKLDAAIVKIRKEHSMDIGPTIHNLPETISESLSVETPNKLDQPNH